jgi:hypothetical protein
MNSFFRLPPPPAVVVDDRVNGHRYVRPTVRPAPRRTLVSALARPVAGRPLAVAAW